MDWGSLLVGSGLTGLRARLGGQAVIWGARAQTKGPRRRGRDIAEGSIELKTSGHQACPLHTPKLFQKKQKTKNSSLLLVQRKNQPRIEETRGNEGERGKKERGDVVLMVKTHA